MINLIPTEARAVVRREYLLRVYSVWALLWATVIIVGGTLLIPTYVLFSKQSVVNEAVQAKHETADADFEKTVQELKKATQLADRLTIKGSHVLASDIIAHIETARAATIALDTVSIASEKKGMAVEVRGVAQTRESLKKFLDTMKSDTFFLDAQVPVSDLAREKELPFTATITLRNAT